MLRLFLKDSGSSVFHLYSASNFLLPCPGYTLPWEDPSFQYPGNFAQPLEVAIEASNGASDYGNKFGEPVLAGEAGGSRG